MRITTILLLAGVLSPAAYGRELPKDGNALLEWCSVLVEAADNPSSLASQSSDRLADKMGQFDWCAGYIQGTEDVFEQNFVNLGLFSMAGLKFAGPEKLQSYALEKLRGPCFPEKAPVLQLARVLVKWLRDHPERLHEPKSILTIIAFTEAFPCEQTIPTDVGAQKDQTKPVPSAPQKQQ